MHKSLPHTLDLFVVAALISLSLLAHIPIALERKIMPAGDTFNFQHIAEHIVRFSYPPQENRLPGYPILILLTRPIPIDPVVSAIGISLATSATTVGILYLLGRVLRMHRVALTFALGLAAFDPLLTISSVRPLSDATFLFFLTLYVLVITRQFVSRKSTPNRSFVWIGLATTAMIFTRFEGIAIAALTLPLLWLRLPWRKVLLASSIPLVTGLAWLPAYHAIHGSFTGGYFTAYKEPGTNRGSLHEVSKNLFTLLRAAGWGAAWTIPAYEIEEVPNDRAIPRLLTQPTWWISILSLLGIPWLLIRNRLAAAPLLLAAIAYVGVLVWWFVYSRFVTPLMPVFYLTVAAGGSFLLTGVSRGWRDGGPPTSAQRSEHLVGVQAATGPGVMLVVSFFFAWLLWNEAPRLYKYGLGRAWESNQKGYALLQAVRETAKLDQPVGYWTEAHAMATLYLKENGVYLNRLEKESPQQLVTHLREHNTQHFINSGDDPRLPAIRTLFQQAGAIDSTTIYRDFVWADNTEETVEVDHLSWP